MLHNFHSASISDRCPLGTDFAPISVARLDDCDKSLKFKKQKKLNWLKEQKNFTIKLLNTNNSIREWWKQKYFSFDFGFKPAPSDPQTRSQSHLSDG